jgi:hypothetical protein
MALISDGRTNKSDPEGIKISKIKNLAVFAKVSNIVRLIVVWSVFRGAIANRVHACKL